MKTKTSLKKIKPRITWGFDPVMRVVKSKNVYSRKSVNNL